MNACDLAGTFSRSRSPALGRAFRGPGHGDLSEDRGGAAASDGAH
ncbi:MAG TPA: hypothetical protein VFD73_02930 [Gemmatimonadales bacterium]|nr:hypothetical protein [Gemmatimonadales bacterium]